MSLKVKPDVIVSERIARSRAKQFLSGCKAAKSGRYLSHLLAHDIGSTSEAVIEVATTLNYPVTPIRGTRVCNIGIATRSLRRMGILR